MTCGLSNSVDRLILIRSSKNARNYCDYYDYPLVTWLSFLVYHGRINSYPFGHSGHSDISARHSRSPPIIKCKNYQEWPGRWLSANQELSQLDILLTDGSVACRPVKFNGRPVTLYSLCWLDEAFCSFRLVLGACLSLLAAYWIWLGQRISLRRLLCRSHYPWFLYRTFYSDWRWNAQAPILRPKWSQVLIPV